MSLTREQILSCRGSLPRESVEIAELGGAVLIRGLTLREIGEFQAAQKREPDPIKMYPRLLAMSLIDADGSPMFADGDRSLIEDLPWPAVDQLARAILRLNKMGDEPGPKA